MTIKPKNFSIVCLLILLLTASTQNSLVSAAVSTSSAATKTATPSPRTPTPTPRASSSPSPQASPSSETTTQNLKQRIEKVVQERREQLQGALDDLSQKKRGFIGQVTRISEGNITVKNQKGSQVISVPEDVSIIKKGKKILITEIAVDDWVILMGYGSSDNFRLRRMIVSSDSLRPNNHIVVLGMIESLTDKQIKLVPRNQTDALTATIDKKTRIQSFEGKTIKTKEISADTQAFMIGTVTADGTTANLIRSLAAPLNNE